MIARIEQLPGEDDGSALLANHIDDGAVHDAGVVPVSSHDDVPHFTGT